MAKVQIVDNWKELKTLPVVEPTKSWNPVPHYNIVDILESRIKQANVPVVSRQIELNQRQQQMFGNYVLEGDAKTQFSIGFRNSTNKSLAIGFCAGLNIVVCSNLQFSGDWLAFRKHSANLTLDEVAELTDNAIEFLPTMKSDFLSRIKNYTKVPLQDDRFKSTVFDMMKEDVIPSNQFRSFLDCVELEREVKDNKGQTLSLIYNATTRLYKDKSLNRIATVTPRLLDYCDDYYENFKAA